MTLLPALLVVALGLSMTVAPLSATVLGAVDQARAAIASAVNNAVARVAGLAGVVALKPLVGPHLDVSTFHVAMAALVGAAGLLGRMSVDEVDVRARPSVQGCDRKPRP